MESNYLQFFTATILEWKHLLKQDKYKEIILNSLQFLVTQKRIKLFGYVIMPNHIHLIWQIQENHKPSNVQRDFLKYTAQQIRFDLQNHHLQVLEHFYVGAKDRAYQIWERNALSIDLYSRKVIEQKLDYIHLNPLGNKWNLAKTPEEYPWSSALYYEKAIDSLGVLEHYMDFC
jgi:putative transposase